MNATTEAVLTVLGLAALILWAVYFVRFWRRGDFWK